MSGAGSRGGAPQSSFAGAGNDPQQQDAQQDNLPANHMDILKMPANMLSEEQKKSMLVEERYTFFQIENKLRQICQDGMDALRTRITKESAIVQKV